MPSVLIIGGFGTLAKHITTLLHRKNWSVSSLIRREEHIPTLQSLGATPILHSLETASVSSLAEVIRSCSPDAIVFAAGGGWRAHTDPGYNKLVDRDGAIRVFDAMARAGMTKRLVVISTVDARNRESASPEWYTDADRKMSDELWAMLPVYMGAKYAADRDLVEGNGARGLAYTIVRPTWYGEGDRTGRVRAGYVGMAPRVSREDVAEVVVACLENEGTAGRVFEVVGGDVEVEEAVRGVVEENVDSFGERLR